MKLPSTSRIVAILGGLVLLAAAVLPAFGVVHWTAEQLTVATAAGTAAVAVVGSVIGHFRKGTAPQPVALAVSVPAFVSTLVLAGNAFGWFTPPLTSTEQGAIVAAVVVIFGGGTAAAAWASVTPVAPHVTAPKDVELPPTA